MKTTPVRYTLKQGSEIVYNGTSRFDSAKLAKELGYVRRPGEVPTAECMIEEVGTLTGTQQYFWFKK